jgi:hypothetical protein
VPPITTTRALNDAERALLAQDPVKLFGRATGVVSAVLTFVLAFLVASLLAIRLSFDVVIRVALVVGAAASVAVYVRIQITARRELRDRAAVVARAATDYVRSTIYTIRDAVAVEEQEDEGLHYYLLLDDGRTLFLSGQYLYEPAEDGFPWESFEIVRPASEDWVLRVVPLGPSVAVSATRAPFSEAEHESDAVPADGTIAQRDFGALRSPHLL